LSIGVGTEIERKFLVSGNEWRDLAVRSTMIRQAYLSHSDTAATVRIRIVDDAKAFLTIKSPQLGPVRSEFEYSIPLHDARELLTLRIGLAIEKRRHLVEMDGARWEVDVFEGAHAGLVIAEIELPDADAIFQRPRWLGQEVTGDPRYYNAHLAAHSAPSGAGGN
jgi:adenylate cyclase